MAGIMVVFDFDKTIIECDSDAWVIGELGLTELFNSLRQTLPWNTLMDTLMGALHSQGKTVEETSDCLKRIPLHPSVVSAIKTAYSLGCDLRIVSDANHFFIETILKNHGLIEYFSEINTNPVVINEEGRLRIKPYHDFHTSPPHGCNLCPPNMCKGSIIERIRASIKKTIIYLGDGSGDFCPSLKLEEGDRVMPRKNFPLWELICKSPTLVRAEVHEWSNAQELGDVLLQLIRGLVSVEDNSSSSNLISDCKSQIPSYPHEAIAKALPVPL